MIKFYDYDIKNPFDVPCEKHKIKNKKITLNYTPLKGTVKIEGFSESLTEKLAADEYYINYDEENEYRCADQVVHFSEEAEGKKVTVSYKGVSTLLRAKHLNEIKDYMERGAPLMVANILIAHETALIGYMMNHVNGLAKAIKSVSESVERVAAAMGGVGGVDESLIATESEVNEVLSKYFNLDEDDKARMFVDERLIATEEEVAEILNKYFNLEETSIKFVDEKNIATKNEVAEVLNKYFIIKGK